MNRSVNYRALLILGIGVPVLLVGVHFLHAFQMKRGASDLLEQVDRAEAEGRPQEMRDVLRDYLGLRPDDAEQQVRYGRALKAAARSRDDYRRAYRALARVVELDPTRDDVRREAALLAADAGLFAEARELAQVLKAAHPNDGEVEALLGHCAEAYGRYDEAMRWYQAAEAHAPNADATFVRHALLLRTRRGLSAEADAVIRRLVAANPQSVKARLAAARYFVRYSEWEDAAAELAFVTGAEGADGSDVYLMAAVVEEALGHQGKSRDRLADGIKKHPADAGLNLAIARIDLRANRRDDARGALQQVAASPDATPAQLASVGELFVEMDDVKAATAVAERLAAVKGPGAARLDARLKMRNGDWGGARVILERLRKDPASPTDPRQIEVLLGTCYERLDDPDAALSAYRRALQGDPLWLPACRGELSVLLTLGRLDEAEQTYGKVVGAAPELNLGLAQVLLARQLKRPAAERQWAGVEAALARLPAAVAKSPEAERFRTEFLVARGNAGDVRHELEAERDRHPDRVGPWLALARYALRQGKADEADKILQQAEARRGKDPALTLARIELASRKAPDEAPAALAALEPAADTFTGAEQARVLKGQAEAYSRLRKPDRAVALWQRAAESAPRDLDVRLHLLEAAYRGGDAAAMEKQIDEVRKIEGPGGGLTAWGEAARCVVLAQKGDKAQLPEARRWLTEARGRRPKWAPAAMLDARIALLEGDRDRAADQFVQAVRYGERDPVVIRAAVDGLYRHRKYGEASELLRTCAEQTLATPDLGRRAAELTLLQANTDTQARARAFEQARRAVPADSKDPHDYQWLAQVARAAGESAEAEKYLRKALTFGDKAPDVWLSLVQLLAPTDVKKAAAALDEARGKLAPEDAPFVLGLGYELIGQVDKAREQYEALLGRRPDDPAVLQVAADFYSRRGPAAKAEAYLRRLLQPDVKVSDGVRAVARRELAQTIARSGTYPKFREAMAVLDAGPKPATREDELARATLLGSRGDKLREARALLEKLAKEGPLPIDGQFLLARILSDQGENGRSDEIMGGVLSTEGRNPAVLAWHVQNLLRRGQVQSARPWLDALRSLEPDSFRTVGLAARFAAKDGRVEEATSLLIEFLGKHPDRRINVALLLEEADAPREAEKLLRDEVVGHPETVLALAEFLSRHQRVSEALALCAGAWKTCPPELVASTSLSVARTGNAGEPEMAALAELFATEAAKRPTLTTLAQARGELAELRGRFDEALAIYQDILRRQPDYVPAMNNRAWLLALKAAPGDEALQLMDRVIQERAGPLANYLDTRAMAYLAAGQAAPAVADMEEAIRQEPAGPFYFHLADARLRTGDRTGAVTALREGRKLGMRPEAMHPLERDHCRQLMSELNVN